MLPRASGNRALTREAPRHRVGHDLSGRYANRRRARRAASAQARGPDDDPHGPRRRVQARAGSMNGLRTRLFGAIALTVALCIGLTVAVGLVLTRRAVDRATLRDVSHQADLVARSQDVKSTISPLTNLPWLEPYFRKQHIEPLTHIEVLPQSAKDRLARGKPANGSVR